MEDGMNDQPLRRGFWARLGIAALNLIAPGLGLFRLGEWRAGIIFLCAPFVFAVLFGLGMGIFPVVGYYSAILALVLAVGLLAAVFIVPIVVTWLKSKTRQALPWWSRWYAILAIGAAAVVLAPTTRAMTQLFYKGYYLPSESMVPTADKNDKVVADMRWRGPLKRGQVIIFKAPDGVRISRVAAMEGDRIAMRDGVPIVNGVPAMQSVRGSKTLELPIGQVAARLLTERFPGEASSHQIMDAGPYEFDDLEEAVVPKGHFFVLGDDRDFSADSRVPRELAGVGMVPLDAIIGRVMYIYWSQDHAKIGHRLDQIAGLREVA